jgi:transcriptional regulator with XRE-family HTH domain
MTLKCECGGELRPARLTNYDFSAEAGYPVTIREVRGLRCTECGGETLDGRTIEAALDAVALEIARLQTRLSARAARYLRKYLGLTQRELAKRMERARETVAAWECGQTDISPQHDLVLRTLAAVRLFNRGPLTSAELASMLEVRARRPGRKRPKIEIENLPRLMRAQDDVGGPVVRPENPRTSSGFENPRIFAGAASTRGASLAGSATTSAAWRPELALAGGVPA